jgi:acid phosphatase type 7
LDTGEDKPDAHPVFAGTAAYEPYRLRQAAWLCGALRRPEIASAPFKVVFCHIPLRGQPNQNDGLSLEGYASWSGDGARAWMPVLRESQVSLIVGGHMHAWRVDEPAEGNPMQVVGGGPDPKNATLIVLDADPQTLRVAIEDLSGSALAERRLTRA